MADDGLPFEPSLWNILTCEVNSSDHVDFKPTFEIVNEIRHNFKSDIIKPNDSRLFYARVLQLEGHRPSTVSDIFQFEERTSNQLMFAVIFIPVPTLNLESSKFIFRTNESAKGNLNWFPARWKIVLNNFCSGYFHKSVISSELHELQVRVTFIPEIKEWIYVFYLLSSPFHRNCHCVKIINYLRNFKPCLLWWRLFLSFYYDHRSSPKWESGVLIP